MLLRSAQTAQCSVATQHCQKEIKMTILEKETISNYSPARVCDFFSCECVSLRDTPEYPKACISVIIVFYLI